MADPRAPQPGVLVRHATSADGTRIAYELFGEGPAVVLIGGALNDRHGRASGVGLARLLATDGLTAIAYDRRGRGDSRATGPSTVGHEIDDIAAVIAAAGGSAALFGMSSGCALALRAAAAGLGVTRIALYDPPFNTDTAGEARSKAYRVRLGQLIAANDNDAALALFLTTIGMPPQAVEGMRKGPGWRGMAALAPTLMQDSDALGDAAGAAVPATLIGKIAVPILAIAGELSPPGLRTSAEAVYKAARHGKYAVLAGQTHDVAPEAVAPVLSPFLHGQP